MKILFLGDIVGEIGIDAIEKYLNVNKYDLVIANAENTNEEHGMTIKNYKRLMEIGINCVTNGNHFFETDDIYEYEKECPMALRPANFLEGPGKGTIQIVIADKKVRITNIIGRNFIKGTIGNPFEYLQDIVLLDDSDIHIVDMHAEATWEKRCVAEYFDGKITIFVGTHTHVQTNDLQKLTKGTIFITDCGMNGAFDSVLGDDKMLAIEKTKNMSDIELAVPKCGKKIVNGVTFEFDDDCNVIDYNIINCIIE